MGDRNRANAGMQVIVCIFAALVIGTTCDGPIGSRKPADRGS